MQVDYRKKIMQELEKVPNSKLANMYRIIHLLRAEITSDVEMTGKKGSLRGIWKGSCIDDSLFADAKKSLFHYEKH